MFVWPAATAVTRPDDETEATVVSVDCQVADEVTF
jgi:hypothetical protein